MNSLCSTESCNHHPCLRHVIGSWRCPYGCRTDCTARQSAHSKASHAHTGRTVDCRTTVPRTYESANSGHSPTGIPGRNDALRERYRDGPAVEVRPEIADRGQEALRRRGEPGAQQWVGAFHALQAFQSRLKKNEILMKSTFPFSVLMYCSGSIM